jgi:hypothetical protein
MEMGCRVSELQERYGLKKSAVYDRLKQANIRPTNIRGVGSFVSEEQLAMLDEYDRRIKLGESIAPVESGGLAEAVGRDALWGLVVRALGNRPIGDPLANHRALQEAVDNGWLLSTALVRDLVGVMPRGAGLSRMGFRFCPVESSGRSTEWRVVKVAE